MSETFSPTLAVPGTSPQNEADLDRFFALSLDLLCVAGFDGYWKRLNPSWTRTLGWTAEEMMSRPLIEFCHPDDREAIVWLFTEDETLPGRPIDALRENRGSEVKRRAQSMAF